jgi:hypothetical protein
MAKYTDEINGAMIEVPAGTVNPDEPTLAQDINKCRNKLAFKDICDLLYKAYADRNALHGRCDSLRDHVDKNSFTSLERVCIWKDAEECKALADDRVLKLLQARDEWADKCLSK